MVSSVEIKITKDMDLTGYTLVEGFPGIGLVGTIAVGYLAEKQGAECIGYIISKKFPPMASIHKGKPVFPARIYVDKKNKMVMLFSEFVVPAETVYDIAESIIEWVKQKKIKMIISLAGMTSMGFQEKPQIYGIASNDEMEKILGEHSVKIITEGVTTGVSGILMAKCAIENVPAMSLLIETTHGYPDPGAAAELLEKVEDITGVSIKTEALMEEARQIETKMKKMMEQMKVGRMKYKAAEEHSPMYG
ncbi:MAG: proteasome assembly chaperone family protein [Candidatus Diapherotrites archaeon]|nr:proteasome assembly chaperone family protein [Candidatus Diapherotrites archaeon]